MLITINMIWNLEEMQSMVEKEICTTNESLSELATMMLNFSMTMELMNHIKTGDMSAVAESSIMLLVSGFWRDRLCEKGGPCLVKMILNGTIWRISATGFQNIGGLSRLK